MKATKAVISVLIVFLLFSCTSKQQSITEKVGTNAAQYTDGEGRPKAKPGENPIIRDIFTADPAPLVYKDTVFLYAGHDEAPVGKAEYVMHDWHVFSSTDMVHWTDRGACLSAKDFSWAGEHAYAGQCVYRDGKFYWYVPMGHKKDSLSNGGFAIGVAVSDSPTGPFTDAIGKALIINEMTTDQKHSWDDIDPTVFVDDDGQAYLYWGNKSCRYVKLKDNMIELDGPISVVTLENFEEAPWLYKRNGTYYLVYAALFPERVDYATSDSPTGPWTYRGRIADTAYNSTTIHPAIIDYHSDSYFFYHNGALPTGGDHRRSICIDYLYYNPDGTIKKVIQTTSGVGALANLKAVKFHSDNGDGTYTNPVIAADFPDPDVILVDGVYYFLSTSMFIFPGVTILKSNDLVNWEYCCNVVERMDYSRCYNLDGCNRYSHGQWAGSLKYHKGKFYLLFNTLDEGGFLCTADKAEGPWEIKHLPRGFHDPSLFFDDDGKIYVAWGYNEIYITELDSNFAPKGKDVLVYTGDIRKGLEGAHVYKINGYYYLYCTYGGLDGFQAALRSKNIYGPYEQKVVIRDTTEGPNYGIHQGALIQTQTRQWWTMLFADSGPFGRFPSLQPVTWQDGWPMVGVNGKAVVTYKKPDVGKEYPIQALPTSDEFENIELGMQWGWNHNPEPAKWSLTQNPGNLRLETVKVVENLTEARNTLTQRIFAYYSDKVATVGTAKMDFSNMKEGDVAGLAVFQDPYAYIGIKKINGQNYVIMVNNGQTIESVAINASTIYLRAEPFYGSGAAMYYGGETVAGTGVATFSYSLDNKSFTRIGNDMQMQFKLTVFTGNKFCLFNYATKKTGGYVDFDWFRVTPSFKIFK